MQLSLFQWDILAVGSGFDSLARLDFDAARQHFSGVLAVLPDHPEAGQGMRDLQVWKGAFRDMEGLDPESTLCFLWEKIAGFPFGNSENSQVLRLALIRRLLALLDDRPTFYAPPDLCRGYLCLLLGDYAAAEASLRLLIEQLPENGRLRGYLADAIWMQGRRGIANASYAMTLLLAPHEVAVDTVCNRRLAEVIQEHGPALAPIYGFLEGVLPLVEQAKPAATLEARSYELLRQAERARFLGSHDEMVEARASLKKLVPEVFEDYMKWLVG
ncbi:MAG: hypothetical protein A2521_00040 [Deltaproteobacteria bacterium RIFOXYD12_FULL_57_12]|nr:MAG: hypothetical protein A2521_00040 [Deltaproteobacteria bacterium RIFOXYD12_FULL_57_12]